MSVDAIGVPSVYLTTLLALARTHGCSATLLSFGGRYLAREEHLPQEAQAAFAS